MTNPRDIVDEARRAGFTLGLEGGALKITGKGRPPRVLVMALRAHEGALVEWLRQYPLARFAPPEPTVERPPHPIDEPAAFEAWRARELARLEALERELYPNRSRKR